MQYGDYVKGPYNALMTLPAGTVVNPHIHKYDEFTTVISGTLLVGHGETIDESKGIELEKGGYLVIAPGIPHWSKAKTDVQISRYAPGPREMTWVKPAAAR